MRYRSAPTVGRNMAYMLDQSSIHENKGMMHGLTLALGGLMLRN